MNQDPAECPIDFNTFILSLSSNALAAQHDEGEEAAASDPLRRALAKQTVDILELLEQKTAGNLTGEEERLLCQVLRDVREHVHSLAASSGTAASSNGNG